MVKNVILESFQKNFPMMFVFVFILCTIRIIYLFTNAKRFKIYEELVNLAFIIYLLSLFYIVTFQDVNYGNSNYIIFKEISRYNFGSRLFIKNVVGNVVLFIPLGWFASYYIKSKNVFFPILIGCVSSVAIEFTQKMIGRAFDIDDIILNVIGMTIGYFIYKMAKHLPKFTRKAWFLNLLSIILTVILVITLLNMYNIIHIKWWWLNV